MCLGLIFTYWSLGSQARSVLFYVLFLFHVNVTRSERLLAYDRCVVALFACEAILWSEEASACYDRAGFVSNQLKGGLQPVAVAMAR